MWEWISSSATRATRGSNLLSKEVIEMIYAEDSEGVDLGERPAPEDDPNSGVTTPPEDQDMEES